MTVSPADEVNDAPEETNDLYDVMAAAVVIGIGARFFLDDPAGNTSTLFNIGVDDQGFCGIPSNAISLQGDASDAI